MNETRSSCAFPHPTGNWHAIVWRKVIQRVTRLQRRIAKAVKEGHWGKVKALIYLISKSFYAKLLAVLRVTTNKGGKTPGVDNIIWKKDEDKFSAAKNLKTRGYSPKPLRRIYILKKNGKKRPLSIPCMHDRAMQALFNMALDPVAEMLADPNSYGFRVKRSCADAIGQCFILLSRSNSAQWIFEADIKACFDEISHQWVMANIPMNKTILRKWLKAGYMENKKLFPTLKGTPQGGIISPTIMNMVLNDMETIINKKFPRWKGQKVNFVRYADDFIITADSKDLLEKEIIPLIAGFLSERGLTLSEDKCKITHINEGFDFLSQNIRKYNGKLLIHPSLKSIQSFKNKLKIIFEQTKGKPAHVLIRLLNPVIRGWSNYHKGICAKHTFDKMATFLYHKLRRWAKYQHGNKNTGWIFKRYFLNDNFTDYRISGKDKIFYRLYRIGFVPIRYHVKIDKMATPYLKVYDEYFCKRRTWRGKLALECKQITTFAEREMYINSRVIKNKDYLKSA